MKKTTDFTKTIVAMATALGSGSIAVVRMSGPDAIVIINPSFKDIFSQVPEVFSDKEYNHRNYQITIPYL